MVENLSPEAIAAISSYLQPADSIRDEKVRKEVAWFREYLVAVVGGPDAFNRLCDEIGL